MVAITRSAGSYALIASASLRPNADALRRLSQASGSSISTTQTTLTGQSRELRGFVQRVSSEADPAAALETTRGLKRSSEVSDAVAEALKAIEQRFASAQSRNSSRPNTSTAGASSAGIVAILAEAAGDDNEGFNFAALLPRQNNSKVKPNQISITAAAQDKPDVFDRGIPLTTAVSGSATISVSKTALTTVATELLLDKSNPSLGSIQSVIYEASGPSRPDNEGFFVKTVTANGDDTIVLDTRDPTEEDTRFNAIEVDTGDGSDVVFIAGNNSSRVNAGDGDDFVAVEGDGIVNGGDGNDLIYARNASGDTGDDVIFTDGFASGGTGNDVITIFSLDAETDDIAKLAFGGSGDDQIVATVRADIDGGDGDDALILRDGGSAGGGAGNDIISAWARATVEGGDGNDDIYLLQGGSLDAGAGDDKVVTQSYTAVTGGTGSDNVSLDGGGIYTFRKGDGADQVFLGKARFQLDDADKLQSNRIVLDGFNYADFTIAVTGIDIKFTPIGQNTTGDALTVERGDVLGKIDLVFRKDGFEQVVKLDGLTQTPGPVVPFIPPRP